MRKLYDGKGNVAVLYRPGYGVGWSTWNKLEHRETLLMDKDIAQAVLKGDIDKAVELAKKKCGNNIITEGAKALRIMWIPKGKVFKVVDDPLNAGAEHISIMDCGLYQSFWTA